jgi:hypothetical protein
MDRSQLVRFIRDKFNDGELRDLCFELHQETDVPPQYLKDERRWRATIAELEARLHR